MYFYIIFICFSTPRIKPSVHFRHLNRQIILPGTSRGNAVFLYKNMCGKGLSRRSEIFLDIAKSRKRSLSKVPQHSLR